MAELVALKMDVLVAGTSVAALAAKKATGTIPIVINFVGGWVLSFPVFRLTGMTLENEWIVDRPLGWSFNASGQPVKAQDNEGTGGNFSVGYTVTRGDQRAFLKAIDLSRAMRAPPGDMLSELKKIIDTASFEKELCALCGQRRMDRVVLALATGDIVMGPNLQDRVPYIIFELADGDVRRRIRQVNDNVRATWIFRALQNAAVGLTQLHSIKIAHQDMKPSNLLHFEKQSVFKLGDVGRAIQEGIPVPHAEYGIAGDPNYAPPELLYGHFTPDWNTRRLGCDLFMFGSLIAFFFLGQGVTPLLMSKIDRAYLPRRAGGQWQGTYAEVMPVVRRAFSTVLEELELVAPVRFREEIVGSVRELCEPDPLLRGHPLNRKQNQFDLSRYVSKFDLLSKLAAVTGRST